MFSLGKMMEAVVSWVVEVVKASIQYVGGLKYPLGETDVDEVKSTNNCFGGMMLIFGHLEALEMEALVDLMDVDNG
uniref:Uncharacterized protein n=1 Tax=Tanacetum cinerariifolium TaxID=118510 RepID=A0A699H357_TANCI|nr:hypothetical protein [Tanacetum cinerariifolium]